MLSMKPWATSSLWVGVRLNIQRISASSGSPASSAGPSFWTVSLLIVGNGSTVARLGRFGAPMWVWLFTKVLSAL